MKKPKKSSDNHVKYGTVSLPMPLIELVKKRIKGTGMNSVSSYVSFVLRQILSSPKKSREVFSKDEEIEVRNRMKSLGYA